MSFSEEYRRLFAESFTLKNRIEVLETQNVDLTRQIESLSTVNREYCDGLNESGEIESELRSEVATLKGMIKVLNLNLEK